MGFFFKDSTMHKIFINKGYNDLVFQIPQLIYSTLVSSMINTILRLLSLTEHDILKIKKEKTNKGLDKKIKNIKSCIIIKLFVFYIFSFILLFFFWYFITCFCQVYTNTQIILIENILISFGLSMIYPFGFQLIPGIFRIYALRGEKNNKKCLYQFSNLLSLLL